MGRERQSGGGARHDSTSTAGPRPLTHTGESTPFWQKTRREPEVTSPSQDRRSSLGSRRRFRKRGAEGAGMRVTDSCGRVTSSSRGGEGRGRALEVSPGGGAQP